MVMIGPGETTGKLAYNETSYSEIPDIAFNAVHLAMEYRRASGNDIGTENLEAFHHNEWIEEAPQDILDAVGGLDELTALARKMHEDEEKENDNYEQIIHSQMSPYSSYLPPEYFMPFYTSKREAPKDGSIKIGNAKIATFVEGPLTKHEATRRLIRIYFATKILPYRNYEINKERTHEHYQQYMTRVASIAIGVNQSSRLLLSSFASEIAKGFESTPKHVKSELDELVPASHMGYLMPGEAQAYQRAILKAGMPIKPRPKAKESSLEADEADG